MLYCSFLKPIFVLEIMTTINSGPDARTFGFNIRDGPLFSSEGGGWKIFVCKLFFVVVYATLQTFFLFKRSSELLYAVESKINQSLCYLTRASFLQLWIWILPLGARRYRWLRLDSNQWLNTHLVDWARRRSH